MPMMCCSPDFTHLDKSFRQKQIDLERGWIDMTAALGGQFCRVLSGQRRPEVSRAEGIRYAAESIEACIPHAIELVAAYRGDVIDFANSLEAAITRQPDLEFRLRKIAGNVDLIASLLNVAGGFIRSMERLNDREKYKRAVLTMALGGPFQIMAQAQIAVDEWMQLFIEQRAPAVHEEAATYL